MKKLLWFVVLLLLRGCVLNPSQAQNVEGQPIASQYGTFQLQGTTTNSFVFSPASCQVTAGNTNFAAVTQGVPIRIVDPGNHALDETLTAGLVNINACSVQLAVNNTHIPPFYLTSGTAGLQEAINANNHGGAANTIVLDASWYALGGSSEIIGTVTGTASLGLIDITTTPYTWYAWSGSAYAKISVGGGGSPGGTLGAIQTNGAGSAFAGTVIRGLVKGNGTSAPSAAVPGIDYQTPITNACSGGMSCPLTGSTYNFSYSGSAGSGTVGTGSQYQNSLYPNSGSTTAVGAASNEYTLPNGLSSSQINTVLGASNIAVTLQPGANPVPFVNTNHNPIHDDNTVVPAAPWNITASGAACDAQIITGAITQGSATLTTGASVFTTAINDGATWVETTGVDPSTNEQLRFDATLTYVSPTEATLSTPAPFTSSSATFIFGHQDNAALADAITLGIDTGRQITAPNGACWSSVPLRFGADIIGQGTHAGALALNSQGTVFIGSAGEDVFQALDPSVAGFSAFPANIDTGNYTISLNPTIDATKAWEICGPASSCVQQTPLYRPIGILGPDAQDPLAPQWIEAHGVYNSGAINGVASTTNDSAVACVPTSEPLPAIGQQIIFPYQAIGTAMFQTTVSSLSGSGCADGTNPMTLAAAWTPATPDEPVEWFSGTSIQNIQTAIPATGRSFPMTIALANPIIPIPSMAGGSSPSGVAPFGYVQIGAEQCAYYGNSNYPASAASVSTPTITLQACAQNGTTAASHSIGSAIVPMNAIEPGWPWPVTPTITSGTQTPANAEFFGAQYVGNTAISFPIANGTDYTGYAGMAEGHLHNILININGGSAIPSSTGYQIQNDTAAMYFAIQPFGSTISDISITSTFYGIVEGTPSINTNNYFTNGFPTADGNHWINIFDQSSALPMDIISEGSGLFSGLTFFSQSWAPPNNYIPGFIPGTDAGSQGNLMLDNPYDDQVNTYPYGGTGVQFTTFQFKYLEPETGFFNQTQPLDYWNCAYCTWINTTPKGSGVRFVNGAFQQFYGGTLNINTSTPMVITGSNINFERVAGMGSSYQGLIYGSNSVLNWGPNNSAFGPGDNEAGTVAGPNIPQLGGDSFAPVMGQTDDTLATGNTAIPYVAKGLGYFSPDQIQPSSLDSETMTGGWTLDPTSPISNSYTTCSQIAGFGCNPAHMTGDYVVIGPGQRIVSGPYYGHVSLKTPNGAGAFVFTLLAQTNGTCTGGTVYSVSITTTDSNWHDYAIPSANFTPYSGCLFNTLFNSDGVHAFDVEFGYLDLIPLPSSMVLPVTTPTEGAACSLPGSFLGSDASYLYICASGGTVKRVGIN